MDLEEKALQLALRAHQGQTRGDEKTPYMIHVMDVADRVPGATLKCIALLHDTMEHDAAYPLDVIDLQMADIPRDVVEAVSILTRAPEEDYFTYLKRVKEKEICRKVKIKDIISNLADNPTRNQIERYAISLLYLNGSATTVISHSDLREHGEK